MNDPAPISVSGAWPHSYDGWRWRLVPWLVGAIQLLASLGHWLNNVPLNRLFELNLCRAHYLKHDPSFIEPGGNVDERFCKLDSIQEELAFYLGLISTLELVCELISTIPMGYVSDKLGRRFVLLLNSSSAILAIIWYICVAHFYETFPIKAIVAGPFLFLFTGFYNVLGANLNALIADTTKSPAQRTAIFAWTQCGSQVISLLGPAISSTAMTRGLWLPFGLGIGCLVLVIPCVLVLPETRPWIRQTTLRKPSHTGEETDQDVNSVSESSPLLSDDMPANIPEGNGVNEDGTGENLPLRDFARKQFGIAKRSFRDMKNLTQTNPSFGLCLLIFLVSNLSKQSINILLQYTSVRYGVSFAEAGYLFSVKAGVSLALYAAIIPSFLQLLMKKFSYSSTHANLVGLRWSLVILCGGAILMALSVELWMLIIALAIYSLGYGLHLFALSYITDLTIKVLDETHVARTYSVVALLETTGHMVGIPMLTAAWMGGIKIGGWGLALPWWLSALFYAVIYIPAHFLKA